MATVEKSIHDLLSIFVQFIRNQILRMNEQKMTVIAEKSIGSSSNSFRCFICGRMIADEKKEFHVNSCLDLQGQGQGDELEENLGSVTASMDREKSAISSSRKTANLASELRVDSSNSKENVTAHINVVVAVADPPASKKSKSVVKVNESTSLSSSALNPPKAKRKPRSATTSVDTNKKLEVEFNKLSNTAKINFLQSKMAIIQHIAPDTVLKPDICSSFMEFAAECVEERIIGSSEVVTTTFLPTSLSAATVVLPKQPPAVTTISSLRLELGEILAKEAELKAKEKKIRAAIKKMQRSLQLSDEFKQVEGSERDPVSFALKLLFPLGESCTVDSHDHDGGCSGSSSSKRPLWQLSFQKEEFDCLAESKRIRQDRDAVLLSEEAITTETYADSSNIHIQATAVDQVHPMVLQAEEETNGQDIKAENEKSLFSQLVDKLNENDVEYSHSNSNGKHDEGSSIITAQLHEEYGQIIEKLMQSVGTWGMAMPETGVKYLEDTIICWEQTLDMRIPSLRSIVSIFDHWRSSLHETGGPKHSQHANLMWSKTVKDYIDGIVLYFEEIHDKYGEIDSLRYKDMHSLVAISFKILSLLVNLQPPQTHLFGPGDDIIAGLAELEYDVGSCGNSHDLPDEEKPITENGLSPCEQSSRNSSPEVISISPSLPPLTQKLYRSSPPKGDGSNIICLISPPLEAESIHHPMGEKGDLPADDAASNAGLHEDNQSAYDYPAYENDFQWDNDYIYSAIDFYEPEKFEVASADVVVGDIALRDDGYLHADLTAEKVDCREDSSRPSDSPGRAVADSVDNQQLDVDILQAEREPLFESMQVYALRDICLQYGLKTDSSRDKMISILRALWKRMHPTSSSSSSTLSQRPSNPSQVVSHSSHSSKGRSVSVRGSVAYAAATLRSPSPSPSPSSTRHRPLQEAQSQESHRTTATEMVKSKKPKLSKDDLVHFIRRDDKLYEQVLLFVPVDLDPLHSTIKVHYEVSKMKLRQFLDELKVFVSGPSTSTSKSGARR